jgi:hypothetical protein
LGDPGHVVGKSALIDWKGGLSYRPNEWSKIFEAARSDPSLRQALFGLDQSAQGALRAAKELYVRPNKLEQIHPSQLDSRHLAAGPNQEQFALAMADCAQSDFVRSKGVELAVMAAYTADSSYLERCFEILAATRDRRPLQRAGWTLYDPGAKMPLGGDGVWLGTAWGIEGIVEMLSVLGDRVPSELRAELVQNLRSEIAEIVSDWKQRRPWYVRSATVQSNQWIEPSSALVRACLFLGDAQLLDSYNLGVRSLAASLEALGDDGAFAEGLSYAAMTAGSLLNAMEDLRQNGDSRCDLYSWPREHWKWWVHMIMPGRQFVNCFDSKMSEMPAWAIGSPLPSMMYAGIASANHEALPVFRRLFRGQVNPGVPGIRYLFYRPKSSSNVTHLPKFAHFKSQQVLTWRSAWEPPELEQSAMAVWIRGGTIRDSHSHRDQGQVSVYNGNRIILMDCGMPDYSNLEIDSCYAGAAGHSTVQVGALEPHTAVADVPILPVRLDDEGGEVAMDLHPAFPGTRTCNRTVEWSAAGEVDFLDRIQMTKAVGRGTALLRFHTGAVSPLEIREVAGSFEVTWPGVTFNISGGGVIDLVDERWPDAVRNPKFHRVLVVRARSEASEFKVNTAIRFNRAVVSRDQ